ncbi:MAG: Gfo/Idh/MocA family oxidoreductase [Anaerolineaceae bacterium]|nr:Gfo/Idh/MocA family oxidoreductase [Anaerolineaceae bacterium]
MKFLIAGSGSIGRRHIRNLVALGEKDIILYRTHQSTLPDEELASLLFETNLGTALDYKPDAVIISNPTAAHMDVALPASEMGCHLLIEKPVSHNLEGIEQLRQNVIRNEKKILIGFQFRFHPVLLQIKDLLGSGSIGRPLSAHVHWGEYLPGWHPWEDYHRAYSARNDLGGGVILTLCHPFDYLRWLIGEVEGVSGNVGNISDLELQVEDNADVILSFENGCMGTVHLDYYQRPPTHSMEITTTKGNIRWNNASGEAEIYHTEFGWSRLEPPSGFERNDLFLAEMKHFLEVVRNEKEPYCDLDDGRKTLEIALAIHESSQNGCKRVTVNS